MRGEKEKGKDYLSVAEADNGTGGEHGRERWTLKEFEPIGVSRSSFRGVKTGEEEEKESPLSRS